MARTMTEDARFMANPAMWPMMVCPIKRNVDQGVYRCGILTPFSKQIDTGRVRVYLVNMWELKPGSTLTAQLDGVEFMEYADWKSVVRDGWMCD